MRNVSIRVGDDGAALGALLVVGQWELVCRRVRILSRTKLHMRESKGSNVNYM
jgi:hypothetical protein